MHAGATARATTFAQSFSAMARCAERTPTLLPASGSTGGLEGHFSPAVSVAVLPRDSSGTTFDSLYPQRLPSGPGSALAVNGVRLFDPRVTVMHCCFPLQSCRFGRDFAVDISAAVVEAAS